MPQIAVYFDFYMLSANADRCSLADYTPPIRLKRTSKRSVNIKCVTLKTRGYLSHRFGHDGMKKSRFPDSLACGS